MFKTIISKLTTRSANQQESHHDVTRQPCIMESMEGRILMASDFLYPDGFEPIATTTTSATTFSVPTNGILIGLLLPAVQRVR